MKLFRSPFRFQATFAAITCALIVGSFAERIKFSAVLLFCALWFTFSYLPISHMVWYWDGPDAITDAATLETVTAAAGWLWAKGALDFAGGTVVHINAAVAGLVGAIMIGKRIGCKEFTVSAAHWMRGILEHEYGLPHNSMEWFTELDED